MTVTSTYRPEIDGLRAFAVVAILLHHAGVAWLPGGYLGVDIFFVISGYVITQLIAGELQTGSFTLGRFWRRRVRRILPALAVLLVSCLTAAWFMLSPAQWEDFLPIFFSATAMVPNVVLWFDVGYFAQDAALRPLLHLWSLGVEEQFYLLFPLLMLAIWRLRPRLRWWLLAGIAAVSLIVAATLVVVEPTAGFYLLPARIWELLAGSLAALTRWQPRPRAAEVWAALGMVLMIAPILFYGPRSPGPATTPPVLGAALCLIAARQQTWVGRGLGTSAIVLSGKVSFGAYLWHWPLLVFARIHLADEPSLAMKLTLMAAAVLLGLASWRWIEAPLRRSAAPVLPRAGIGGGIALMAGLAGLGLTLSLVEKRGGRVLHWPGYQPQEVLADDRERDGLTGAGTCHLVNNTMATGPFRAAWNCPPKDRDGARAWPVALFGDSHAGDFAMVLRLSGRNPMQMSGYGCSIVPSNMRDDCRAMAEDLRRAAATAGLHTVILVNQWDRSEVTPEALVELELWWGEAFDQIVLVGPLPKFADLGERLLRWPKARLAAMEADTALPEAFEKARKRVQGSEMLVLDAKAFFCADRPGCSAIDDTPLMRDKGGHLSVAGARIYAQGLMASGVLDRIAPQ